MSVQQESSYKEQSAVREEEKSDSWVQTQTQEHDTEDPQLRTPDKYRSRSASPPPSHHSQPSQPTVAAPLGQEVWDGALGASARNPDAYVRDLRMALSPVPHVKPHWQDRYMKILVVGESGLGKTTFIKNLFASYAQNPDLKVNDASARTSIQTFRATPDKLCTQIVAEDKNRLMRYIYQVQDSPGWENLDDSMDPILDYINDSNVKFLQHEQDAKRDSPLTSFVDPRVDVCFYFIAPHRIKDCDVHFITQVSELVPVMPILAKADCMTSSELEEFRKMVNGRLSQASREAGRELVLKFPKKVLQEAGARPDVPPFAVIASRTMDRSVGRFWPVRQYPWGTCEAHSSEHSDVASLKKLLFEVSYEELKTATEERYYNFRERELLNPDKDDLNAGRGVQPRFIINRNRRKQGPLVQRILKMVVSVGVIYFTGALIIGGKERLHQDARIVGEHVKEVAQVAAEKAKDVALDAKDKAVEAKDYVVDAVTPEPPKPKKKGLLGWGTPIF